jgi:hypothetical protein
VCKVDLNKIFNLDNYNSTMYLSALASLKVKFEELGRAWLKW